MSNINICILFHAFSLKYLAHLFGSGNMEYLSFRNALFVILHASLTLVFIY